MNRPVSHAIDSHTFNKFREYLYNRKGPLVAIFDIGTKACRIILAPKDVPLANKEDWRRETFFNGSGYYKLGEDVDPASNILSTKSQRLWKVIKFVRFFTKFLTDRNRVEATDFHFFGTEVFRWLKNQEEILNFFKMKTGYELNVLSEDEESYFSLISLQYTIGFHHQSEDSVPDSSEYNLVFLIDQGGGSTEISYFNPKRPHVNEHTSIGKFGSIALKEIFFRLDSKGNNIDPLHCNYSIPQQIESLSNYIDKALKDWTYYGNTGDLKKVFYGMGSAIHNLSNSSNLKSHNKKINLQTINDKIFDISIKLNNKFPLVSNLYEKIDRDQLEKDESKDLTTFYGLPVYAKLLEKFGVDSIQLAGFGLRYGIYIYLYASARENLDPKELPNIPILYQKPPEVHIDLPKTNSKVFLSHSSVDKEFVNELNRMLEEQGIETWFDKVNIKVGDDITVEVTKGIDESNFFLIVLSENSISSNWVKSELGQAYNQFVQKNKKILPIVYGNIKDEQLPEQISRLKYADFRKNFDVAFQDVIQAIKNQ